MKWTSEGVPFAPAFRHDPQDRWAEICADPRGRTHRIVWNADTDMRFSVQLDGVELETFACMNDALAYVAGGSNA